MMSFPAVLADKHYLEPVEWHCLDLKLCLSAEKQGEHGWAVRKQATVLLQTTASHFPSTSRLYLCFFMDVPHKGERVVG